MNALAGELTLDQSRLQQRMEKLEREVRKLRRELRAKEEELLSQFYLVSHELKTPLISIRGFANLLQEFHAEALGEEGRGYLRRMIGNVDQMEKLINNLLLISKLRVDEEDLELVPMKEIVEEAVWEQDYQIKEKGAQISIPDELPAVRCHRELMVTVFSNLISNAVKYSKPSVPAKIQIGYSAEGFFHKFWVRDNGVGIPPKDRDKLFQMFSRLGNKKGTTGSGLGLAIVKRIIEAHGGEVWVKSRRGVGSCFYFTLLRQSQVANRISTSKESRR